MMDITDGLAIDLDRICEASGVGAILDERAVLGQASAAARELSAESKRPLLDHILGDGEDFELLYAADSAEEELSALGDVQVGEIVSGSGLQLRGLDGKLRPLEPKGYQHL
jgi:thiamine-monophosphate kinase